MNEVKQIALDYAMQLNKGNVADTINAAREIEAYLGETGNAEPAKPATRKASASSKSADTAKDQDKSSDGTSATTAASPSDAKEEAKPVETISRDDMLTAATLFTQKNGDQALVDTLDQMGASKFSEVPAERYAEFKALLDDYQPKGASALD